MITDTETWVREEFRAADVDVPVDAGAILAAARHAQRVRRGVGAAILVVVLWLLAVLLFMWPGAVNGLLREPMRTAVPNPMASPTSAHMTANIDTATPNGLPSGVHAIAVEAVLHAGRPVTSVVFWVAFSTGEEQRIPATVALGQVWTHRLSDNAMIALVPSEAWVDAVFDPTGAGACAPQHLPGWGVTPVWVYAQNAADLDTGVRFRWEQPDGSVTDGTRAFPQARMIVGDETALVFYDPQGDRLVYVDVDGHVTAARLSGAVVAMNNNVHIGLPGGQQTWRNEAIGILPPGGHAPQLTFAVPGVKWAHAPLTEDGRIVFVAVGQGKETQLVKTVVYLDGAGKKVTVTP